MATANYKPNALTPLFDAIGYSVGKLRFTLENEKDYAVLVTIFTDGAENASKEFTRITIANIIRELEKKDWLFTYIGAHHDATDQASGIEIKNFISITSNSPCVSEEMEKEKARRGSFYSYAKAGQLDKLKDSYFTENNDADV